MLSYSATAKTWSVKTTSTGELLFPQMTPTGGTVQGMPVLVTAGMSQQIVAVAADGIAAALGVLELEASDQVTYQLDTAPDSPPTASTVMVSAWQSNQTMIKVTRYWTVEPFALDRGCGDLRRELRQRQC